MRKDGAKYIQKSPCLIHSIMTTIGYLRVSTDEQDLLQQEHLLLKHAQQNQMQIDRFIRVEVSTRKSLRERRIEELLDALSNGDTLVVAELSRLGRNMFQTLELINTISEMGVKLIFVRQPELSTTGSHGKLLLAIYSYFAEAERDFISMRTKQGMASARAQGKHVGRPKGSRDKHRALRSLPGTDSRLLTVAAPASTDPQYR